MKEELNEAKKELNQIRENHQKLIECQLKALEKLDKANKRLFVLLLVSLLGIFFYLIIPDEITVEKTQEIDDTGNSQINQVMN